MKTFSQVVLSRIVAYLINCHLPVVHSFKAKLQSGQKLGFSSYAGFVYNRKWIDLLNSLLGQGQKTGVGLTILSLSVGIKQPLGAWANLWQWSALVVYFLGSAKFRKWCYYRENLILLLQDPQWLCVNRIHMIISTSWAIVWVFFYRSYLKSTFESWLCCHGSPILFHFLKVNNKLVMVTGLSGVQFGL